VLHAAVCVDIAVRGRRWLEILGKSVERGGGIGRQVIRIIIHAHRYIYIYTYYGGVESACPNNVVIS